MIQKLWFKKNATKTFFIDPEKKLFEGVDDIEEVLPEIEDLTDEEYDELVEYVKGKWNYDEENLDWIVDTAIEAGRGLMMMINMQKTWHWWIFVL